MSSAHVPVWRPSRPSVYGNRIFAFSPKLKAPVEHASRLESERRLLIEWDRDVESFATEPAVAEAYVDGKMRRSRIDFWVRWRNGHERFEEVKYAQELVDRTSRAHRQIAIQKSWCASRNVEHAVVTDREIWANPTLINSLFTLFAEYSVSYLSNFERSQELSQEILEFIRQKPNRAIHEILSVFDNGGRADFARLSLFELIRLGCVEANIESERLSPRTKISPVENK